MKDLIRREDVIKAFCQFCGICPINEARPEDCEILGNRIDRIPAAEPVKRGEWTDIQVFPVEDTSVEELQSARCSVCGKIHTTPYMYYFDEHPYCPRCGAKMTEEADE